MGENSISSILYLGIGLFILPIILSFMRITVSHWFYTAGIIVIIIGAFHTMLMRRPK
jgi:hypothetical protein